MTPKRLQKKRRGAMASIYETAEGLHAAGVMDKQTMRRFDEACHSLPGRQIVSYTADELDAMIARGEDRTDWARASAKSEEELAVDTASDPAWNDIPEDWHKDAVACTGPLFRPKENKQPVHIRFDADVLEFFKRGGRGWQGRMNAVLRSFMERQH